MSALNTGDLLWGTLVGFAIGIMIGLLPYMNGSTDDGLFPLFMGVIFGLVFGLGVLLKSLLGKTAVIQK